MNTNITGNIENALTGNTGNHQEKNCRKAAENLKVAGVVAEFNPFHNGHKRLLSFAKEECKADFTVVVMSGDFVQRGLPAIMEKRERTRMALLNGADLVLELPVRYATASAPVFALGAIASLSCLNVVDQLVFGTETGLDILTVLAEKEIMLSSSEAFHFYVKEQSKKGIPYPEIRMDFLLSSIKEELRNKSESEESFSAISKALSSPNSILGIEYLKALRFFHSSIRPAALKRNDKGYHDETRGRFCSATALRMQLNKNEFPKEGIPENCLELLNDHFKKTFPVFPEAFDLLLYDRILSGNKTTLSSFQDVDPDSAGRFRKLLTGYTGFQDFSILCAQKQKTVSRTLRMLCHILLRIPQFYPQSQPAAPEEWCPYLRVLGMKKEASLCLAKASVPVITKLGGCQKHFSGKKLPVLLEEDLYASRLYQQAIQNIYHTGYKNDYQSGPVILK